MNDAPHRLIEAAGAHFAADPPRRLGVAVSGGSDSMALLVLLADWARERPTEILAATVDHGLRPEAAAEARAVAALCAELGLSHVTLVWTGWDGSGNTANEARKARYRLLAGWARGAGVDRVALGHTADDCAETFLMRLSRAAGVDGLSRMDASLVRQGVRFDRPLLDIRRHALREELTRRGLRWIDDPGNDDPASLRVRARRALAALEPLQITVESLCATAANLAAARAALAEQTASAARAIVRIDRGDVILDRRGLDALPAEIRRRLLAGAILWLSRAEYAPRAGALREVLARLASDGTATLQGCLLSETGTGLRVGREWNAVRDIAAPVGDLWDGRWRLSGPAQGDETVAALGEAGLAQLPDWRAAGLPRPSLLASPSIWRKDALISAPLTDYCYGWRAELAQSRDDFIQSLISH